MPLRYNAIPTKGRESVVADEPKPFKIEPSINVKNIELRGGVNLDGAGGDLLYDRDERGIVIRGGRIHYT
jgi:hypothetical protein